MQDTHYRPDGNPPPPDFVTPYSASSFSATQYYMFDDTETAETHVVLRGPMSIDRAVGNRIPYAPSIYWYSCTKSGSIGWYQLP